MQRMTTIDSAVQMEWKPGSQCFDMEQVLPHRRPRGQWFRAGIFGFLMTLVVGAVASAQDDSEQPAAELKPVLVYNVSSLKQSLDDMDYLFKVADRPDMMEVIETFLSDKAGDLKGIDRTRPLGVMVFVETSLPPRPRMVVYVPVSNEEEFITTLQLGRSPITKVKDHEYEVDHHGKGKKSPLLIQGNYGYFLPTGDEFLQGREIPNPGTVAASLIQEYDVALSIRISEIPFSVKEFLSGMITQKFASKMKQRKKEPDTVYQVRKAHQVSAKKWMEQLLRDGEAITLGLKSAKENQQATIEFSIQAKPESEFAKYLTGIGEKSSPFESLLGDDHPLQVSTCWNMDAREEEAALGHLKALRMFLKEELPEAPGDQLVDVLEATARQRHIDGFMQFNQDSNGSLVTIGGFQIVDGKTFGTALKETLTAAKAHNLHGELQLDSHQHQGVTFHQYRCDKTDDDLTRIYGRTPDIMAGVGQNIVWFGFGGDGTLPALDAAIDASDNKSSDNKATTSEPFQMILHVAPWLKYAEAEKLETKRGMLVQAAMKPGADAMQIEFAPTESGGQMSMRFDNGFVKLLGSLVAQKYDRKQK